MNNPDDVIAWLFVPDRSSPFRACRYCPLDLALAWGDLALHDGIDQLEVSQVERYYLWNYAAGSILDSKTVTLNSANMHIIPADDEIRAQLLTIRKGDKVRMRGRLVDVRDQTGETWRTSITRSDMGAGACEILLVDEIQVEPSGEAEGGRLKV